MPQIPPRTGAGGPTLAGKAFQAEPNNAKCPARAFGRGICLKSKQMPNGAPFGICSGQLACEDLLGVAGKAAFFTVPFISSTASFSWVSSFGSGGT